MGGKRFVGALKGRELSMDGGGGSGEKEKAVHRDCT